MAEAGIPLPNNWYKISYFHCSLLGYFLGLLTATVSSEVCHSLKVIFLESSIFCSFLGFQSRSTSLVVFSTLYAIPIGMYGLSERGFEDHVARAFCKQ